MLNILKYVRPGGGFVPKFPVFSKVEVNGLNEDPLFTFLKVHWVLLEAGRYKFTEWIYYPYSLFFFLSALQVLNPEKLRYHVILCFTTGIFAICQPCYWRHKEILLVSDQSQWHSLEFWEVSHNCKWHALQKVKP